MKNLSKSKVGTILIVFITLVLAGVAIFTAYRLYQLRQTSVAPNVPSSNPKADTLDNSGSCTTTFTIGEVSPSPSGSSTASPTATTTASTYPSGTPNSCGGTCGSDANCMSGYYICYQGFCRDKSCPTETDCTCNASASPTPVNRSTAAATAASLPQSGTNWPTVVGAGAGIIIILGSLLLAL